MAKIPYAKEALKNLFKSPVTKKYPQVAADIPEGYRGKIKFDADTCVGCGMCIRVCAAGSIEKKIIQKEGAQEITMTFNMGSCTFCGLCSDFCPKNSIELTKEYSMITGAGESIIVSGTFEKKLPPKPDPAKIAAAKAAAAAKKAATEKIAANAEKKEEGKCK